MSNNPGERSRQRVREPEPEPAGFYDWILAHHKEVRDRVELPHVVRSTDVPWQIGRNGKSKYYSTPRMETAVLPDRLVFRKTIEEKNGRHTHQGGLAIMALHGEGETLVGDERFEWEAGDLIILPIQPGGIEHQHFNRRGPDDPAEWLAFIYEPYLEELGSEMTQNEVYKEWQEKHHEMMEAEDFEEYDDHFDLLFDFDFADWLDYESPDEIDTVYDKLIDLRNQHRRRVAESQEDGYWAVIKGDDLEWEWNPQGKMKWYLYPDAEPPRSMWSLLWAVQEIPPGSRSGKQHRQGGQVHFIIEGEGHTIVDGPRYGGPQRFDWEKEDYLGIPVSPEGCSIQHFNEDPENPAQFVVAEPAHGYELGWLDLGCGFTQIENCPEYDAQ